MKTIGFKLFLSFLAMAALTIGLLWLIQAGFMKDSYLESRVGAVASGVRQAAGADAPDLETLKQDQNINLVQFDAKGDAQSMPQGLPKMGMVIRACQAMIPDQVDGTVQTLTSVSDSGRYALLGYPMKTGGYLFAVFSLADVDEASRILRDQLWLITLLLLLFAVVLAVALSRRLSRPIRAVTAAARELARGRLDVVLPVKTRDEIGTLTVALNDLSVQLQNTENLRKELIANVSHELRAPLAVIQGYAETVRDVTWPVEEKRTQQLSIISEEASRLSRVVKDILDYSRLQAGVDRPAIAEFAVQPALERIRQRLEIDAAKRDVSIRLDGPDLPVRFDPEKFEQVLNNLLNNAVNHADPGTAVTIRTEPRPDGARILVTNIGPGIPPADQPRIWDRYYQVEQRAGEGRRLGTGLGLAIVKSIFEHHHVAYGVVSENRETTFWFDTCGAPGSQPDSAAVRR